MSGPIFWSFLLIFFAEKIFIQNVRKNHKGSGKGTKQGPAKGNRGGRGGADNLSLSFARRRAARRWDVSGPRARQCLVEDRVWNYPCGGRSPGVDDTAGYCWWLGSEFGVPSGLWPGEFSDFRNFGISSLADVGPLGSLPPFLSGWGLLWGRTCF